MTLQHNNSKAFVFNTIAGVLLVLCTTLFNFIVPKLILVSYGKETMGLISSITQLLFFFMLVDSGLANFSVVSLYKPLSIGDYSTASRILSATKNIYYKIALFFLGLIICAALLYPLLVKEQTTPYIIICSLVFVLGLNGIFEFLSIRKYSILLTADNIIGISRIVMIIRLLLQCAVIFVLINLGVHIIFVELVSMAIVGVSPILLHFICRKRYSQINFSAPPDMESLSNRYEAMVQPLTLALQVSAPILVATILLPIQEVGVLAMYMIVVRGVDNIINVLSSVRAGFGRMYANQENKRLERAYEQFELLNCFLTTIVFSVLTVNFEPFIKIYSGYTIDGLVFLCCIRGFLINLRMPQDNMLNAIGWFKGTRRYMITQTGIQLVASVVLGWKFGVLGIFIGDILSNIYRDVEILIHIPYKVGFRIFPSLKRWIVSIVTFVFLWAILPCLKNLFSQVLNYKSWVLFSAVNVIFAGVVATIFFVIFDRANCIQVYNMKMLPLWCSIKRKVFK